MTSHVLKLYRLTWINRLQMLACVCIYITHRLYLKTNSHSLNFTDVLLCSSNSRSLNCVQHFTFVIQHDTYYRLMFFNSSTQSSNNAYCFYPILEWNDGRNTAWWISLLVKKYPEVVKTKCVIYWFVYRIKLIHSIPLPNENCKCTILLPVTAVDILFIFVFIPRR